MHGRCVPAMPPWSESKDAHSGDDGESSSRARCTCPVASTLPLSVLAMPSRPVQKSCSLPCNASQRDERSGQFALVQLVRPAPQCAGCNRRDGAHHSEIRDRYLLGAEATIRADRLMIEDIEKEVLV